METTEQYTVKTPDKAKIKLALDLYNKYKGKQQSFDRHLHSAMEEYSSELIKENERLKGTLGVEAVRQNMELKEALKTAIGYPIEERDLVERWNNDFELFPLPICFDPREEQKELYRRSKEIEHKAKAAIILLEPKTS